MIFFFLAISVKIACLLGGKPRWQLILVDIVLRSRCFMTFLSDHLWLGDMKMWEFCRGPVWTALAASSLWTTKNGRHFVVCPGNLNQPRNGVGRKGSAEATAEAMRKIGTTAENPWFCWLESNKTKCFYLMLGWTSSQVLWWIIH